MSEESPKTVRWDLCLWICPRCGLTGNDGLPAPLELVDSRDPDVSLTDAWDSDEFDPEVFDQSHATAPVVYCQNCGTTFDVNFEPRED